MRLSRGPWPTEERNRLTARAKRYASVGANVGGVAARMAGARFLGMGLDRARNAVELAAALGGLKGPIMKVAQLLATIPEALPPEYIAELTKLQSQAPPMGWAFVKRRMQAELGPDWQTKFAASSIIPPRPLRSARCIARRRTMAPSSPASCSTPTCSRRSKPISASSACCSPSGGGSIPAIDTTEMIKEIGARMREELDYRHEAKHAALYRDMLADEDPSACRTSWPELSTGRLLTLDWLEGGRLLEHKDDTLAVRNRLAKAMFTAWWVPFSRFGVIHGDPHLGNYTVLPRRASPPASTCSTTAASASSRRTSSAAWSISTTACATATTRASCTPTRPGASASSPAN